MRICNILLGGREAVKKGNEYHHFFVYEFIVSFLGPIYLMVFGLGLVEV